MNQKERKTRQFLNLPDYPQEQEPAPRAHGDPNATYDPLSYLLRYPYETLSHLESVDGLLLIDTPADHFVISNEHTRFSYPVAVGQKQDEKWYYVANKAGPHRLYIATRRDAYKVYASCHVEVYDEGFNLLGKAGEVISINDGRNYFIRTYGIGQYDLYVAREAEV